MCSRIFTCSTYIDMFWRGNVSSRLKDVICVSRDVIVDRVKGF